MSSDCDDELQEMTKGGKLKRNYPSLIITASEEEIKQRSELRSLKHLTKKLKCTKCCRDFNTYIKNGEDLYLHPLLKVLFCEACCKYYGDGNFSVDEDEEDKYCRWCGEGGRLFLCSRCICGFCSKCINRNLGANIVKSIKNNDNWSCFICQPKPLYELRNITYLAVQESKTNKKKTKDAREKRLFRLKNKVVLNQKGNSPRKRKRRISTSSYSSTTKSDERDAVTTKKSETDDSSNENESAVETAVKSSKAKPKKSTKTKEKSCKDEVEKKIKSPIKNKGCNDITREELKPVLKTLRRLNTVGQLFSKSCERLITEIVSTENTTQTIKFNSKITKMANLFVEMVNGVCEKKKDASDSKVKVNSNDGEIIIDFEKTNCDISILGEVVNLEAVPEISILSETGMKEKKEFVIEDTVITLDVGETTADQQKLVESPKNNKKETASKKIDTKTSNNDENSSSDENMNTEKDMPSSGDIHDDKLIKKNKKKGPVISDDEMNVETFDSDDDNLKNSNKSPVIECSDSDNNSSRKVNKAVEKKKDGNEKKSFISDSDDGGDDLTVNNGGLNDQDDKVSEHESDKDENINKSSIIESDDGAGNDGNRDSDSDMSQKVGNNGDKDENINKSSLNESDDGAGNDENRDSDSDTSQKVGNNVDKDENINKSSINESDNGAGNDENHDSDSDMSQKVGNNGDKDENINKSSINESDDGAGNDENRDSDSDRSQKGENNGENEISKAPKRNSCDDDSEKNDSIEIEAQKTGQVANNNKDKVAEEENDENVSNVSDCGSVDNLIIDSNDRDLGSGDEPDNISDSNIEADKKGKGIVKKNKKDQLKNDDNNSSDNLNKETSSKKNEEEDLIFDVTIDEDTNVSKENNNRNVKRRDLSDSEKNSKSNDEEESTKNQELSATPKKITKSMVLATSSESSDDKNKPESSSNDSDKIAAHHKTSLRKKKLKMRRKPKNAAKKNDDSSSDDENNDNKHKSPSDPLKITNKNNSDDSTIKSLTNLKSLERRKKSSAPKEGEKEKTPGSKSKKTKKKDETLLDMLNEMGVNSNSENDSDASQGGWLKSFCNSNMNVLKELVLGSSSSNEVSSEDDDNDKESTSSEKKEKVGSDEENKKDAKKKRRKSSDEESEKKKKKKRVFSDSDQSDSSTKLNDSSDDNDNNKRKRNKNSDSSEGSDRKVTKKKKISSSSEDNGETTKKWKRIARDESGSESASDVESSQKTTDSPNKGRKNIRNVLKKDLLKMETKAAVKAEEARKANLKERKKKYDSFFSNESKRLILDFNDKGDVLVEVSPKLVKKLKPHQFQGVKFMWDNLFESIACVGNNNGSGCILAHCMGLGKTLQVITLLHTVFTENVGVETALIVCPLNTVANWIQELEMWLGVARCDSIDIYDISKYKRVIDRRFQLKHWNKKGGIMIMSYDMFRNCTKKPKGVFETTLLRPGPDMVVCDEGHLLKNEDSVLSKCMSQTLTSRRIVLTGTPLQNNLKEYHCMVQFIKPNLLGTKKEFMNRFVNPIENGQFEDSTEYDVRLMKRRSHVLHTMLDGCIQRRDYTVLTPFLPPKQEYVLAIRLSEPLSLLYKHYIKNVSIRSKGSKDSTSIFHDYHALHRIWTHPLVMQAHFQQNAIKKAKIEATESDDDFIDDDDADEDDKSSDEGGSSSESSDKSGSEDEGLKKKKNQRSTRNNPIVEEKEEPTPVEPEKSWWNGLIDEKLFEDELVSHKLTILFSILDECTELGDKCLVFSQSLYTLDLIEHFLDKRHRAGADWKLGKHYFRLDGSSSIDSRASWCKAFNREDNVNARLFLISTKAGGLGINLVGANRVVIFDASWNPSHDLQSIFRVFRFGQKKPCFVYRLLAEATMEEKIYARQVTKLSLAGRVVDEHQIERHYTMGKLQELYEYEPLPRDKWKIPLVPKDPLLAKILKQHENDIVGYHEHDSLLENKEEEELTETERKTAWAEYENSQIPNNQQLAGQAFQTAFVQNQMQRMPANRQKHDNQQLLPNPLSQLNSISPFFLKSMETMPIQQLVLVGRYYNMFPMENEQPETYRQRLVTHLRILSYREEIVIN